MQTPRKWGFAFIFSAALLWLVTAFLIESIVTPGVHKTALVPPFVLTFLATNLLTLYLPLIHIISLVKEWCKGKDEDEDEKSSRHCSPGGWLGAHDDPTPRIAALWATPLWFSTQYTFNLSLAYTSVTSNTILNSTVSLFAFGFSIMLLGEKYNWKKLMCIIACIAGTAFVTLADSEDNGDSGAMWGDGLILISACLYAAYTVVLKWKMPGEEAGSKVAEFFGYLGLFNTIMMSPVAAYLFLTGDISLSTIPREAYMYIGLQGILAYVMADYMWARGVMIIGPTIATVCQSIQIPVAAAADLLLGTPTWAESYHSIVMALAGTLLILFGLFGINMLSGEEPTLPKTVVAIKSWAVMKAAVQMKGVKGVGDKEETAPLKGKERAGQW